MVVLGGVWVGIELFVTFGGVDGFMQLVLFVSRVVVLVHGVLWALPSFSLLLRQCSCDALGGLCVARGWVGLWIELACCCGGSLCVGLTWLDLSAAW